MRVQPAANCDTQLQMFRKRLSQIATGPSDIRSQALSDILGENLEFGFMPPADCVAALYGEGGIGAMWKIETSEPMQSGRFSSLLAALLSDHHLRTVFYFMQIQSALSDALISGEGWFVADEDTLRDARKSQYRAADGLLLWGQQAAAWLLSKPKRADLVPDSLVSFVSRQYASPPQYRDASHPEKCSEQTHVTVPPRARGRRPVVTGRVKDQMRDDLRTGKITMEQLCEEKEKCLSASYDASRDICRKVRVEIMSEYQASFSDK